MWKYEGRYIGYQDGTSVTQFWFIQDQVLTPNLFPKDGRLVGADQVIQIKSSSLLTIWMVDPFGGPFTLPQGTRKILREIEIYPNFYSIGPL